MKGFIRDLPREVLRECWDLWVYGLKGPRDFWISGVCYAGGWWCGAYSL